MRRFDPTAERTKAALAAALRPFLPEAGVILEVASGSGLHAAHLAAVYPSISWLPSDRDDAALASIAAHGFEAPLRLDVTEPVWPAPRVDGVLASYLAHLLDDAGREALFRGAARALPPGGRLFLFGPVAARRAPVASPSAALRGSIWCPVIEVPDRATLEASAARQGLRAIAAVEVGDDRLLVFVA